MACFNTNSSLFKQLQTCVNKHHPQGSVGVSPYCYAKKHLPQHLKASIHSAPSYCLPSRKLSRAEVRRICRCPHCPELIGFLCVMAWGGGQQYYIAQILQQWPQLQSQLSALKTNKLSRSSAYHLFSGSNRIKGLGPAFFTKLIYFFSPDPVDCYIMDQWTAKSINLLCNLKIVKMNGNFVSSDNLGGNYQAFCEKIDCLAAHFGISGEKMEEILFSKGGRKAAPWRAQVKTAWPSFSVSYSSTRLQNHFPHIPLSDFA